VAGGAGGSLELCPRGRIAAAHRAQQILRLMLELIEIGTDGQVTIGHDGPPWFETRGPLARATRRFVRTVRRTLAQVDSVLSADGWRPARRGQA
jgi:hypothetical protein